MKILILSPYLPWPLKSGGNAAQFSTLKCLSNEHEFTVVCPVNSESQIEDARQLARELPKVRVRPVWCGGELGYNIPPDPMMQRMLRHGAGFARRLLRPQRAAPAVSVHRAPPYDPLFYLPQAYVDAVALELENGVDLVQVEFADMLSLGPWLPATIPKLFIHHQLHFVYVQRCMTPGSDAEFGNYLTEFTRCREVACLRPFDGIVTFSDADRDCLVAHPAMPPVFTSPFPVPADVGFAAAPAAQIPGHFSFLGSQEHFPNCDALEWLLDRIWPAIIRELPDATLSIIGQWSDDWKERAATVGTSVVFTGFVADLGRALWGGIQLVPLRIGSGIRTKILAALAQGVPCVATTIAAEGLQLGHTGGVLLADEEDAFVQAALRLARNPEGWKTHATAGLESAAKNYSPESVRMRRNEVYAQVVAHHRSRGL